MLDATTARRRMAARDCNCGCYFLRFLCEMRFRSTRIGRSSTLDHGRLFCHTLGYVIESNVVAAAPRSLSQRRRCLSPRRLHIFSLFTHASLLLLHILYRLQASHVGLVSIDTSEDAAGACSQGLHHIRVSSSFLGCEALTLSSSLLVTRRLYWRLISPVVFGYVAAHHEREDEFAKLAAGLHGTHRSPCK